MADNVAVTAGSGTTIAADEVVDGTLGTVKVQYVKIMDGTLDSTTKISPATSAKQDTGNTSLASIDGKVTAVDTGNVTVVSSSLPTGAATGAKQDTGNTSVGNIDTTLGAKADAKNAATDTTSVSGISIWKQISASVQAIASSVAGTLSVATHAVTQSGTWTVQPGNTANTTAWKVDGSAVTQPVSASSLPLPTGAATSSNQTNGNQLTQITDGTNTVNVLKNDGTAAGQNAEIVAGTYLEKSFTTTSNQALIATDASNYKWVSIHVLTQGTSARITFQGSNDNTNWVDITLLIASATGASTAVTSTTGTNQIFSGPLNYRYFRLNVSSLSAGTSSGIAEFFTVPPAQVVGSTAANQSGTWTVGSNSATGSAVPSNAFYGGAQARTSLPSAATAGNLVGAMADKFGRAVVLANAMRDLVTPITQLTLSASTSETTLISAMASTFLDIVSLIVINTSATATQVDFRDSTSGTIRASVYVPAGETRGIALPTPLPQSAVNNNWTAKCSASVSSVIITGSYISNA